MLSLMYFRAMAATTPLSDLYCRAMDPKLGQNMLWTQNWFSTRTVGFTIVCTFILIPVLYLPIGSYYTRQSLDWYADNMGARVECGG